MKRKLSKKEINENKEILFLFETLLNRFEFGIISIKKMFEEMDSTSYKDYYGGIHHYINSPMEDSIKFKYITLIEKFKRISKAINDTYFFESDEKPKNRYTIMNRTILNVDEITVIERVIDERNFLAHVWVEGYSDYIILEPEETIMKLKFLKQVLNKYKKYHLMNDKDRALI